MFNPLAHLENVNMSALDIAIIVILTYFLIRGIFRGVIKEIVGIFGLFIAFWVASTYWQLGSEQLTVLTKELPLRGVLSFVIIFLIVYFLVGIMSVFVDKAIKMAVSPFVSSMFGGILGLFKGSALIVILLTNIMGFLSIKESFFQDSLAFKYAYPMTQEVKSWVPERIKSFIDNKQSSFSRTITTPPPTTGRTPSPQPLGLAPPTNLTSLLAIMREHPLDINPAWMEKLDSLTPQSVDPELLKSFVRDHPNLFGTPEVPQPWGQPALQDE
ncbi:MAG: CvpA family protein [Deltaproteobacteria bacterium]|jgi:membrane protein required for colicin V production|nr:CvpA family protein [Deltaproteobacteria bacterium]